jgi:hypothetical protein
MCTWKTLQDDASGGFAALASVALRSHRPDTAAWPSRICRGGGELFAVSMKTWYWGYRCPLVMVRVWELSQAAGVAFCLLCLHFVAVGRFIPVLWLGLAHETESHVSSHCFQCWVLPSAEMLLQPVLLLWGCFNGALRKRHLVSLCKPVWL